MDARIIRLYQAYDNKANIPVGPIIAAKHPVVPTRSFVEAIKDKNVFGTYPEDFELREIGWQNDDGTIIGHGSLRIVITGEQVKNQLLATNDSEVAKYE